MREVRSFRCIKWITSTEEPELPIYYTTAGNIDSRQKVSPLSPGVRSDVIIPEPIVIGDGAVASTSHIEMAVDDTKAGATYRMRYRQPRCIESVRDGIIFPDLRFSGRHISGAVATDKINLAVKITGRHETAYTRHSGARAPGIACYVINSGGITNNHSSSVLPAENVNFIIDWRINRRREVHHVRQGCECGPGVAGQIVTSELIYIPHASIKRVTTGQVNGAAIGSSRCPVNCI